MRAQEFSAWLSAIAGMSVEQRRQALQALTKVGRGGRRFGRGCVLHRESARKRAEDALGTMGVERVESRGCPHCAGREIVGWGRSDGLLRFRCKSCGRTFNALTKTPMAHLRKKEKLARSRPGDDRGHEPGEDRETLRRPSDHRLPLAASVSPRAGPTTSLER